MKNLKRILTFVLALTLVFALFACGQTEDTPGGECQTHVDKNADGICDTCKKEIKKDDGGDECVQHVDENEDGYCDVCDECYPHIDDDDDNYCDYCGACIKHTDEDEDGICDDCEEEIKTAPSGDGITLISADEILFQVVLGNDVGSARMVIDDFVDIIEELGYEISVVAEDEGDEADIEVLIGTVTSRGEDYEYDKYSLGSEGYVITAVDESKIVITGGSETTLTDAFTIFFEEYLGISSDADYLEDFTFTEEHEELEIQDNYRVTSVSIDGVDLEGYEIVREKSASAYKDAAEQLQNYFYTKAGYWLPIVTPDKAGDKTISFVHVEKDKAGSNGFRVRVDDGNLIIECAYDNLFEKAFNEYYNQTFTGKIGDVELSDFVSKEINISVITYEDYGAKGDGKTDDIEAIRAAHNEANKGGQKVLGTKGKTYYITFSYGNPIQIKTDVDWRGAKFIFDSRAITYDNAGNIFEIAQDLQNANKYIDVEDPRIQELNKPAENGEPVIKGIEHGDDKTMKLDLGLGYPAMLTVINKNSRTYIRWGYVDSKGGEQQEVVVVDENGNMDETTPFLLDYEKVTAIRIHRLDVTPITVENATVEQPASLINLGPGGYHSYAHGIAVTRPNTTVKNLKHVITGEILPNAPVKVDKDGLSYDVTDEGFSYSGGKIYTNNGKTEYKGTDVTPFTGPSFSGFIQVSNTNNVLVEGCVFQARYHYEEGTYDISAGTANQIVFKDCTQSNFFDDRPEFTKFNNGQSTFPNLGLCWGIMGSNYTKNMHYINCELTRYDAHAGVYNGSVVGGKIGVLRLIGGGTFRIENVEVYRAHHGTPPFQLREDYGATFYGDVIIKDVIVRDGKYSSDGTYGELPGLFDAPTAPWDNGYVNHFPNIVIDNVEIETSSTMVPLVTVGGESYSSANHFPSRSLVKEDVSNPNALFTTYFETKNPNIVEEDKERFHYLQSFKKVDKAPEKLSNGEYTVVDNKDETYTVIAKGVPNINPYQPPEFIEIKNMKGKKNSYGKALYISLYSCNFFKNTTIIDEDGVLKRESVPK